MWGGFPPGALSKEDMLKMFVEDDPGMIFGYLRSWWEFRHEPNVLMLHFKNLKDDLPGEVAKIAGFLEINASSYMDVVLEKASFAYMKKNEDKYTGPVRTPYGDIQVLN